MADSSDDGTCPSHPAIQLRRRQRRTGEWKVILSACPLCASGIPPADNARPLSTGAPGRGDGRGGAGDGGRGDGEEDDNKSVQSSLSYTPRATRSSRSRHGDDDDNQSVRSSRSEMPSSSHSSIRSSSRSRRSGSRGSGHAGSGHNGGSGHVESRSSSRSRSHHSNSHQEESRSSSRSRGHASRHSAHGGFDASYPREDDDRSVSSKYSTRSASRTKSRHAEERHSSHSRGDSRDRGDGRHNDRSNETDDEEEGHDDHSHAHTIGRSVSSLSTRPMGNHKQREEEEVQPMGVRFHPETKPPDERSVVSGSVVSGESSSSNESGGSQNLSECSGGSAASGRDYQTPSSGVGTHPSHDSSGRTQPSMGGGGNSSGGRGIMKRDDDPSGGYGIMGGEITGDHLSDRNLDMISNIASAISAANSAKSGGGGNGGGGGMSSRAGGGSGSSRGGVPVPTKGEDNDYRGSIDREGYGSEEYATEEEEGSYSSLEDGSRTSSFVDSKQPLPQQIQPQPQAVPVRGVLRPSSFGPTAKKNQDEESEEESPSIPSSRRSSYLSEESGPSVDHNEALVMYQEQDVVEELDEPRHRHREEQGQGWSSPAPNRQSNAKQARYPPPPRNNGRGGQQGGGIIRPPSFNDFNDHQSPEYQQGKVYDGEPVNTPVEEYGHYESQGQGMSPAQQQQYRPPPRDQSPQVHRDQHSNYQPPPRDHDEEQSVHSQGRRHNESRRSSSRARGRDNDEDRSVHSQGRREGRGSQRHSSRPRSRSQSRSRSALRGRDELHDSQTSQPKPVGILRNSKHSKQPQPPQVQGPPRGMEPPSPNELLDTSEHSAPTMMHGQHVPPQMQQGRYREPPQEPHRMQQGGRGPPYGSNNGLPPAPRSGPPAYPMGPQGHPMGEYDRPWNAPGGGSQGSPPTKPHKSGKPGKSSSSRDGRSDNYLSQTEPETSVGSREGSDRSNDRMSNAQTAGAGNAANPMGAPSEFDDKGRCVKHPHIKLRKKKLMGGWKVLLVNCPDCCIEEMLRMKRENNGGGGGGRGRTKAGGHKGGKRRPSQDGSHSNSSNQSPPISQLTIRTHGQGGVDNSDVESTGSSASEITFNTRTDYSKGSNPSRQGFEDTSGSGGSGPHRVTRMPFTDAYGDKGWYTGDVASGSGLPHGQGTMHYCDGRTREGFWSNGLAGSGGGPRGKNAGQRGPPPTHPPPHRTMRGDGSVNSRSSGNHHLGPPPPQQFSPQPPHRMGPPMHHNSPQQHPPHPHPNLPPPPKQHMPQTNGAVFNMEWTDLRGRDGRYTGETDESGEPHGMGSVRYDEDDTVLEGEWYHGELERRIQGLSVRPAGL